MYSIILCVIAFAGCYFAGRKSLVGGLVAALGVGYMYGILRANLPEAASHFIFDAAVLGLYFTQLPRALARARRHEHQMLRLWVGLLIVWPCLLFLAPVQDYLVQFVGLRGNIFLLPFILLGARLESRDVHRLVLCIAVLNLIAVGFALAEYVWGVEQFFPLNDVTEVVYKSQVSDDVFNPDRFTGLRIPATFSSAHAFAGTMVLTLALLMGMWLQAEGRSRARWQNRLLTVAIVLSIVAVFMAAVRSSAIMLFVLLAIVTVSGRLKPNMLALWLLILAGIGFVVVNDPRLQRFTTLNDAEFVSDRFYWSVNQSLLDVAVEYPMGNGLGGGGTSIPYFLQGRVAPPTAYLENEYARIMLEQGVPGVCLWVAFLIWVFMRREVPRQDPWRFTRRLLRVTCAAFFATGLIGIGLLTSVPGTCLLLLSIGWIAVRQPDHSEAVERVALPHAESIKQALARHYG